jgi:catechol 2,3-dioxygenase-like lactoylglutathione lyase family enzyme
MTSLTDTSTAIRAEVRLKAAVPTFLVPDVAGTARWYSEHLGFRTAGTVPKQEPYAYASLQRDGAEIMLLSLAGYEKPDLCQTSRRALGRVCPDAGGVRAV